MFSHIIHNSDDTDIIKYNKLITEKPKGNNLTLNEKIKLQREWGEECNQLLLTIRTKYELKG